VENGNNFNIVAVSVVDTLFVCLSVAYIIEDMGWVYRVTKHHKGPQVTARDHTGTAREPQRAASSFHGTTIDRKGQQCA